MSKSRKWLIEKVKQEYEAIYIQTRHKEMLERAMDIKFFPKVIITDKDIYFTAAGNGKKRMTPYWHDIIW